jgi:hypothetical protein
MTSTTTLTPPVRQGPPDPLPDSKNAATLHLCAAAYVDRQFRDKVIDEVYDREDRAIAPNPGTDAVPILRHVLRARVIDVVQQAFLTGMIVILLCTAVVDRIGLVLALIAWGPVAWLVHARDRSAVKSARPRSRISVGQVLRVLSTAVLLAFASVALYILVTLANALGADLPFSSDEVVDEYQECLEYYDSMYYYYGEDYGSERCEEPPEPPGTGSVALALLLFAGATATAAMARSHYLATVLTEPEPQAPSTPRAAFIGEAQRSQIVNYHAGRLPFVGSGFELPPWQFAIGLYPADAAKKGGGSPMTIDPAGLGRSVRERMRQLGEDSRTTRRLPNLKLADQAYVSGRDIAAPVYRTDALPQVGYPQFQTIDQIQADPTTPIRHYLRCEVNSWDGELITTVFIHCALQGETLYVEFSSCILPPTPERYHVFGPGGPLAKTGPVGFLRGLALMPFELARSPYDLARYIQKAIANGVRRRFPEDHGAVVGIRELGAADSEQNYFQYRDAVKYIEIMERQLFDALVTYLRENNVDTGELEERANTIVNNGVINYGKLATGAAGANASANVGAVGSRAKGSVKGGI